MIELGKYAVPVLAAWGITGLLLAALVAQTVMAAARARCDLDKVEERRRG